MPFFGFFKKDYALEVFKFGILKLENLFPWKPT